MINQTRFVTLKKLAAAAVTNLTLVIRHEHMQHLGRANSVQDRDAKSVFPFLAQMCRQGFTCRDAKAKARRIKPRRSMLLEQQSVNNRHTKEDCGPIITEDLTDHRGRRFL